MFTELSGAASRAKQDRRHLRHPLLALASLVVLAGCASVGPDYRPPDGPDYPAWHNAVASTHATPADARALALWWTQFHDPTLDALIDAALAGNTDLKTALARLDEVRARRGLARAQQMPELDASASARTQAARPAETTVTTRSYDANLSLSWELDLFGGKRRALEAAEADLAAAQANLYAVRVSLIAAVANAYVDLRTAENRLAVLQATLDSRGETDQITRWREQAGLASTLDVAQSRSSLEQARAALPAVERSLSEARNQIALLLGKTPGAVDAMIGAKRALPELSFSLALGIPADTLQQRPDVRVAERQLAAATARVGEAQAQRYPKLTLSGSIGVDALSASDLFRPEAVLASLAGGIAAPIFDAGRITQSIAIQDAQQQQALINWQATVLRAMHEVENALVAWRTSNERFASLGVAVTAAVQAEQLASQRYAAGLIDLSVLLDTQRTLLSLQDQQTSAQGDRATALVNLYKALGGGWSPDAAGAQPAVGDTRND
ncbi:efflux transporter outer membrane subunit [Niveibacterium umoris]|uniref:NodT family efflux transporter outer membrane factor (OMF) lipoprotein n=1 Tax=Niveibacterium umoris TaxID=1193620 RepID=A0A840BJZ1_9RHOO|nr:efflux transporter outer membrane subunit [Niveibacterium umoris]MBB4012943.1 NodT family efflux transporter outer membrane factor (OMF) lipoprotein [Niveibacterium umoris]